VPATAVPPAPAVPFSIAHAVVAPRRAVFGAGPVRIRFSFTAPAPTPLRVAVRASGARTIRRWRLPAAVPPGPVRLRWDGLTTHGHAAPDGRYRVVAGPPGARVHRVGSLSLRGHVYPVAGPHSFRGAIGLFGAPRNGGRRHGGFDIVAACGTPVVAARSGLVKRRRYDPVLYGNYMIVRGGHERVEYWYAHLRSPGRVREGRHVRTGQRLGDVGATGNARTVGCHLHFEMHGAGGPFDPLPRLRRWEAR
jgi:murein DD-endopeptidase MepM/ murein hydrolase activator NlpD